MYNLRREGKGLKKRDLEKQLKKWGWYVKRHGGSHDYWTNGEMHEAIPRHSEINEMLAKNFSPLITPKPSPMLSAECIYLSSPVCTHTGYIANRNICTPSLTPRVRLDSNQRFKKSKGKSQKKVRIDGI